MHSFQTKLPRKIVEVPGTAERYIVTFESLPKLDYEGVQ